jgi:site-specific DNA-cytosine methylase
MFSLIQKHRPDWVIGENVAGHITMGLDQVLADLESENYATRAFVIPACAADAHHRRDRVWIVANATKLLCNGSGENSEPDKRQISELGERGCKANVPNSMRSRSQRQRRAFNASDTAASKDWQEHRTKHDGRWCPEPNVGRVAHGISSELDGDLNDEEKHYPNEGSKSDAGPNRMPRVSGKGQTREASPGLYETQHIRGSLPSVSHQGRPAGRNPQKEAAEGLQDMRDNVFAKPHKETQHMQQEMSVRDRPEKRNEALVWPEEPEGLPRVARGVPDRVNRLKSLGNAVVPQVVERIGEAILEADR